MDDGMLLLCGTAAAIGFAHTLLGPDHYVPFVAMSRLGKWSARKTLNVTLLCGLAHVLGSVVLGIVGIALGVAVFKLERVESARGEIAGWLFTGLGLAYFVWGLRRAIRNTPHTHLHAHADGTMHAHVHTHQAEHLHVHGKSEEGSLANPPGGVLTPWVLFTIFGFGPCEPLIPMLMYPAAKGSAVGLVLVTTVFTLATVATMLVMVFVGCRTMEAVSIGRLERFSHALAGFALFACGVAIQAGL